MRLGKLVDDWRQAWKWFSVQLAAFIAIAPEVYQQVSGMKDYLPESLFHHLMAALGVTVILGRLIEQGKKNGPN